jgi:RNA polymerase sigma-70 factor, ECF subfamily
VQPAFGEQQRGSVPAAPKRLLDQPEGLGQGVAVPADGQMAGHLGPRRGGQLAVKVRLHGTAHTAVSPRADHQPRNPARTGTIPRISWNARHRQRVPSIVEPTAQPGAPQPEDPFSRYALPEVEVLLRVARTLTSRPADAEDLVQDTLLRAYQGIDRFDGAHPRAWLLTILRNTHINRNRRRRPELLDDQDAAFERLASTGPGADSPEGLVVGSAFDAVVTDALAALPDRYRQIVTLVDINGLSYAEAAQTLGVPEGTVMSRLHRARTRMRHRLVAAGMAPRRKL